MSERKREIQVLTEKALTVFIAYYFSLDSIRFLYYMKVNDGSNYLNHDQVMAAVDAVRVLTMMREHDVCSKGLFVVNVCLELLYEGKAAIEDVRRYKQIMKELRLNTVLLARAIGAEDNEEAYFWKRVSEEKNNFDVGRGSQLASRVYRQAVRYARSLHDRTKGEKSSKMLSKIRHFILPRLESEVPKLYSKDVQMLEEGRNRYYESQMDVSKNQEGNNNMMYDIWREILCGNFKQPFYVAAEAFQLAKKGGFVGEIYKKAGKMFVDGAREMISEDRVVTTYYAVKSANHRRNDVLMSGNLLLSLARSVDAAYQIAQHHRRLYSYLLREERLLNQSNQLLTSSYEPLSTITFIPITFIQLFTEMTFVSNSIIKCLELMISTEKLSDQSKLIIENYFSFCNNIHSLVQAIYMTEKELQGFIQKIHENCNGLELFLHFNRLIYSWIENLKGYLHKVGQDILVDFNKINFHCNYWKSIEGFVHLLRSWKMTMKESRRKRLYYEAETFQNQRMIFLYTIASATPLPMMKRRQGIFLTFYFNDWSSDDESYFIDSLLKNSMNISSLLQLNEKELRRIKKKLSSNNLLNIFRMNKKEEMLILMERLYENVISLAREYFMKFMSPWNTRECKSGRPCPSLKYSRYLTTTIEKVVENFPNSSSIIDDISDLLIAFKMLNVQRVLSPSSSLSSDCNKVLNILSLRSSHYRLLVDCMTQAISYQISGDSKREEDERVKISIIESLERKEIQKKTNNYYSIRVYDTMGLSGVFLELSPLYQTPLSQNNDPKRKELERISMERERRKRQTKREFMISGFR